MMGGVKAGYDCIKAFSETDFTEDLKKFDVPTLILHGDDDQIVPIGAAALQSSKLVKGATLKVYPGFPHGMPTTQCGHRSMPICSRSSNKTYKKKRRDRLRPVHSAPGTCTGFSKTDS
jgi:pimeloyl-ACP methyl ester carboxylesterase